MERWTNHIIETDYGRVVCTHSSNEVFDSMDQLPDLKKVIKRLEALDDMLTDYDADGEFCDIEDRVMDEGGKIKLLYESLRDIQSLALVLVDEVKLLNNDYDGTLTILEGLKEERFSFCQEIDKLTDENEVLRLKNAQLQKENVEAKIKLRGINSLIDRHLKK